MSEKALNLWWNELGYDELYRLMYIPNYKDDNDFIEKCDEYWEGLDVEKKRDLYNFYKEL